MNPLCFHLITNLIGDGMEIFNEFKIHKDIIPWLLEIFCTITQQIITPVLVILFYAWKQAMWYKNMSLFKEN